MVANKIQIQTKLNRINSQNKEVIAQKLLIHKAILEQVDPPSCLTLIFVLLQTYLYWQYKFIFFIGYRP